MNTLRLAAGRLAPRAISRVNLPGLQQQHQQIVTPSEYHDDADEVAEWAGRICRIGTRVFCQSVCPESLQQHQTMWMARSSFIMG